MLRGRVTEYKSEFPTGGKVRDPRKAADPVTGTSQNSGTDSKVWMREEHE